jgi:hypothetical protein
MAWTDLADARLPGQEIAIADEPHIVGQVTPRRIYLRELPVSGSVAVAGYVASAGADPGPGQFHTRYEGELAGTLEFHASADGAAVMVSYLGRGSILFAHALNGLAGEVATRAPAEHRHPWAVLDEVPATASRWPTYLEVADRPSTLAGLGITDAVAAADPRLTDARTPTPHGSTHAADADPIPLGGYSLGQLGVRSASDLNSGNLPYARLPASGGTWNLAGGQLILAGGLRVAGVMGVATDSQANVVVRTDRFPLAGTGINQFGLYMYPQVDGSTASRAVVGRLQFAAGAAAGTGTCLWAQAPTFLAGASAATLHGLLIGAMTGAASNWQLLSEGTAPSAFAGPVTIGAATAPNAAAVLDLSSTARGMTFPRMTTLQRNAISATPPRSLTVYNVDVDKLQTYNGVGWQDHY